MTAQETFVTNAAEATLTSSLGVGSTTINVDDTTGFPAVPFYAVIEPDVDANREIVLVDSSKTATTFVLTGSSSRGQDGTADVAHDAGATIAVVPVAALWTDINDRVDAVDAAIITDHGVLTGLSGDDHTQYLNSTRHDARDHVGVTGVPRIVSGTYTGDGTTDRTITLAFTPKFVIVTGGAAGDVPYALSRLEGGTFGLHHNGGTASASLQGVNTKVPFLTTNGFTVSGNVVDELNHSGSPYFYVAFG